MKREDIMKKQNLFNVLLALAVVVICIRLFNDFDSALLGATNCIAMYVMFRRKNVK